MTNPNNNKNFNDEALKINRTLKKRLDDIKKMVDDLINFEYDRLVNESGIIIAKNLNIKNVGHISRSDVLNILSSSSALIFPSLAETLGIPLLEATALGVPIVASEFDYVRDIASPIETFNPHSPVSIADAVQRFVGFERALDTKFFSAKDFVEEILNVNEQF